MAHTPAIRRPKTECGTEDKLSSKNCKGLLNTPKSVAKKLRAIAKRISSDPEARAKVDAVLSEMQVSGGKTKAGRISAAARHAGDVRNIIDAIKKDKNLKRQSLKEITKLISDNNGKRAALNAALAALDDCLLARKCKLVPYKIDGESQQGKDRQPLSAANNGGCCPGQTGHHLITDQMVTSGTCKPSHAKNNPQGYHKDTAPTVCVEGENQYHGTHGLIHAKLGKTILRLERNRKSKSPDGRMSLDEAIDAAAESHSEAFPRSKCSEKCIKAQLRDYYGKSCPGARFATVNKYGSLIKPNKKRTTTE